ncbi:MAG: hypothetical protein QXE64_01430 [Candidatus Pacearchaeota archaeon]
MAKLKWFEVKLEGLDKEVPILGESLESLANRVILYDMTRDLKGKMAEMKLRVAIENSTAIGKMIYFGLIQNYARRLVRKGTSPVEDSFIAITKDGVKLRIKPLLVTRKKVVRNIRKKLREKARELITSFVNSNDKVTVFNSVINYVMQKQILKDLKKIYPLLVCEIRRLQVVK